MLIPSLLLLACTGETKEDPITSDTGIEVEDTQTEDTSEDTQDTSETDSDTQSDTEDTADTEDAVTGVYRAQSMAQVLHQTTEGEQVSTAVRCLLETDNGIQILDPTSYAVTVSPTTVLLLMARWSILQSKVSMRCLVARNQQLFRIPFRLLERSSTYWCKLLHWGFLKQSLP